MAEKFIFYREENDYDSSVSPANISPETEARIINLRQKFGNIAIEASKS